MIDISAKRDVEKAIVLFQSESFERACLDFWNTLGYKSDHTFEKTGFTLDEFKGSFSNQHSIDDKKAITFDWKQCLILFQLTEQDIRNYLSESNEIDLLSDFTGAVDNTIINSYLFMSIELSGEHYTRTQLASITREINRCFAMPVLLLYKYTDMLTLSVISRRISKKDDNKDVLEKVTIIKDINTNHTHRAHIDILSELNLAALFREHKFTNFVQLKRAWEKTLDIKTLNKKFFIQIRNWYLWAIKHIEFPQIRPETEMEPNLDYQSKSTIRFITRFLFCWFLKEKQNIVPSEFFNKRELDNILKAFDSTSTDSDYYRAILQNLFFATLSVPQEDRKYISEDIRPGLNPDYGKPHVFRYQECFSNLNLALELFRSIPFLNGGLFDCLDRKAVKNESAEVRLDGFSKVESKQAKVPNYLFWGTHNVDLSQELDSTKAKSTFVTGLIDLFEQYIFTVEESTPIEEEIALDPELLGRVFENMLAFTNPETHKTVRKGTGSFYTPRKIVDYMVDLTLKEHLSKHLKTNLLMKDEDITTGLDILFTYTEADHAFNKREMTCLIRAIDEIKVIDPACGSGAFLMGMLHKMTYVLSKIDPDNKIWFEMLISRLPSHLQEQMRTSLGNENVSYNRKLGLIQQCIYGVDIQPIAVQIAKLRFFLTLIIEQDINRTAKNFGIVPLPNLEFKLISADTIAKLDEHTGSNDADYDDFLSNPYISNMEQYIHQYFSAAKPDDKEKVKKDILNIIKAYVKPQLNRITKLEAKFAISTDKHKKKVRKEIDKLHFETKQWESYKGIFDDKEIHFFNIKLFFPEVSNGFDIVIGNPPYIQLQNEILKDKTELYEGMGYKVFNKMGDIYCLFYERGMDILNKNGLLCYITSNKWMRAPYGNDLRQYFDLFNPKILINIGPNVFESATVETNILLIEKAKNDGSLLTTDLNKEDETELDFVHQIESTLTKQQMQDSGIWFIGDNTMQQLKSKIGELGIPIKECDVKILRGILTGYNEAFIIDEQTKLRLCEENFTNSEIIQPIIRGRNIQKYLPTFNKEYLLATGYDIDIPKEYPSIYKHLLAYKETAMKRTDQGKNWYNLRPCNYYDEFLKEKIVWKRIGSLLRFSYDVSRMYTLDSTCIMTGSMLYEICAILNSKLGNWILYENAPKTGTGDIIASVQAIEPIRMPLVNDSTAVIYQEINSIVGQIIHHKDTQTSSTAILEDKIDHLVYKLYNLTPEEITLIEKGTK